MINPNIQRTDILKALDFIDIKGVPKQRKSTKYNLIYNEKSYPPKYVISIANKFVTGEELNNEQFSGGTETNNFLSKHGFIIEETIHLKLPKDYYQRAYSITKKYIDKNIDLPLKEAKQLIAGNGNHNTANYHIYGIKGLLTGEKFTSKLTEESLDFYLSFITREFGLIGFKKAVVALGKHLKYRIEDLGENPVSFKRFVEKYRKEINLLEDEIEQAEILQELEQKNPSKASLIAYFKNLKLSEQKKVAYSGGKAYKRDNVTVANLKRLRNFTCQICQCQIKKADGSFYIEAAHIYPKAKGGEESPRNLLILCPNHHKEFDYGQREILMHTDEEIEFNLNGINYKIYIGLM